MTKRKLKRPSFVPRSGTTAGKGKKHTFTWHQSFFQSVFYVVVSLVVALLIVYVPAFHALIVSLGDLGFVGAFIAGMFFVSIFTAAPAAVVLFTLAETHPILPIAILAGFGSIIGDLFIISVFSYHKKQLEILLPKKHGIIKSIEVLRHSKYKLLMSILGALVVASPLPDEFGLALMGFGSMPWYQVILLSFFLNTIGVYILLLL